MIDPKAMFRITLKSGKTVQGRIFLPSLSVRGEGIIDSPEDLQDALAMSLPKYIRVNAPQAKGQAAKSYFVATDAIEIIETYSDSSPSDSRDPDDDEEKPGPAFWGQ